MTPLFRSLGSALCAFALTAVAVAQTTPKPALDLRMGLWEVTSVTSMGGMSTPDTSKMTPQQQAQLAAMAGAMGLRTSVSKSCMTAEKFVTQGAAVARLGVTCKQTIQTNTRTLLENTMTCTGERPSTAVSRTEATSPTAFKSTVTSTSSARGQSTKVTIDMTGKWLGAACGDVK